MSNTPEPNLPVAEASADQIENGCRGMYGPTWDGPPEKMPGEKMKEVWRTYSKNCLNAALATPIPDTSAGEREVVQQSIATKQSTDATAASVLSGRPCTCHPDDSPPSPCPQKYALSHCRHSERYQVADMQPSPVSVSAFAAWHPVHGLGPVNEIALRDQVDHAQTDVNLLRHSGDSLWEVVRVEVHKGHWF